MEGYTLGKIVPSLVSIFRCLVSWFKKSAKQGNADAQANLGFCYMTGQGVPEVSLR